MTRELIKILSFITVAFVAGILLTNNFLITSSTMLTSNGATITYHSAVCESIIRTDGTVENLGCSKNLFNNDGKSFIADQVSSANLSVGTGIVNVIAVGTKDGEPACISAQSAADQYLCGEETANGLARAVANAVRLNNSAISNGNWSLTREFTYTGGSAITLNTTGLFNSTTANDTREIFFAQNTFTDATLNTNDKINITWFIWVV